MAVDFSEKAKRYQAIDEIIQELQDKYEIHTSRTSFFRDIEELQKNIAHLSTQTLKRAATFIQTLTTVCPVCTQMKTPQKPPD